MKRPIYIHKDTQGFIYLSASLYIDTPFSRLHACTRITWTHLSDVSTHKGAFIKNSLRIDAVVAMDMGDQCLTGVFHRRDGSFCVNGNFSNAACREAVLKMRFKTYKRRTFTNIPYVDIIPNASTKCNRVVFLQTFHRCVFLQISISN